ncbi:hypothetical protein KXQ82_04240 [Mucilaginibacter sp. HMF5004]|uniref:hypothetical protein n=1 Tax=Mucilaginibacter rivuli TaxID=2857527 RepID=UPI001C60316F|nr:hypothetical protein [Mucilaginibacter rivuli]MBW4888906.1 hypothetical protein [Mucilaginibacter rivuli]
MEVIITPEFKDLFPGEVASVEELLTGVPSKLIIQLLALINAELYSNDAGQETQVKIMKLLMARQTLKTKQQIIGRALEKMSRQKGESTYFFSPSYNMNFMHYELTNYRELPDSDSTAEQELNVFKAYFLIAEQAANQNKKEQAEHNVDDPQYFEKMMWPSLIDQFEVSQPVNPYLVMLRGIVFLNYLQVHSEYGEYVKNYLKLHGKATAMNYVLDICQLLMTNFKSIGPGGTGTSSFFIRRAEGFETLFEQFTINVNDYRLKFSNGKSNYSGIKAKPLFRLNEDTWIVLNWSFLGNKMYEGLIFDFYENSGIKNHPHFKKFIDFKNFTGHKITEGYLARKLLEATYKAKRRVLLFDDQSKPGFPDAYYRTGNKVTLFEIKDAYFPAGAVNSFSYEKIMEVIDLKMNNSGKGTGQLLKQIQHLSESSFEDPQGYKYARNLEVFPIIVYGDIFFNMPGMNLYLERSFRKQVNEKGLDKKFKKVHPLTFINISFFLQYFDLMQTPATELSALIAAYQLYLIRSKKKFNRTHQMVDHFSLSAPFEQVASKIMREPFAVRDYVRASLDALNITEGLPAAVN